LSIRRSESSFMENNFLQRLEMLVGPEALEILSNKRIIVFGVGGVGGQAAESLARSGIGSLTIVDRDIVDITNINRQIIALNSKIGQDKVEVLRQRLLDINPNLKITAIKEEVNFATLASFDLKSYDFVVDAIDSIYDKINLIMECVNHEIPIISSMGAGNRLDPTQVFIADIFQTTYDPLAKMIREHLRKAHVKKLAVVTSKEQPKKTLTRKPSSSPFVPPAYGLAIASYILNQYLMYNIK